MAAERVSVALAAYRGEAFIAEQLDSLLAQSRPPDEIVVCDDSPDEATGRIVAAIADRVPGVIRYERNPATLGVGRNFEKAIALCTGDIIFLCDQDDVWKPEKIAHCLRPFAADPAVSGVFCDSLLVDAALRPMNCTLWKMRGFAPEIRRRFAVDDQLEILLKRVYLSAHNIAFRASCREFLLPFPELIGLYADTWIGLMLAAAGRWAAVAEPLTLYRVHGANASAPGMRGLLGEALASRRALKRNHLHGSTVVAENLLERLPEMASPDRRRLLAAYVAHCAVREALPRPWFRRLAVVWREWRLGNYRKFSVGWKRPAADLLGRSR